MCRTRDKSDESLKKLVDLVDKSNDDMGELENTTTYMAEMMKDEKGDGDDDIWMSKEDQNPSEVIASMWMYRSKAIMKRIGHMNKMSN
jgi:hypothetical protein